MAEWTNKRIRKLQELLNINTYLEVGVAKGATFLNVNIPQKDAVDPNFLFDNAPLKTESVRFFEMTSDQFFTSSHPRKNYDLIFLDGLHEFEQTFRDFLASLSVMNENTVWIIDDTLPCDVYSSLRDPDLAFRARKKAGLEGNQWHGDTFKTVYAIHDLCPQFEYATFVDHGNPQTLVWQSRRKSFRPAFKNLEEISRTDYFSIEKFQSIFKFGSEENIFNLISQDLKI